MLQLILEPIFAILFFGLGYVIGFFPVMIGSFGALEPGPIEAISDPSYYRSMGMKWWHLTFEKDGRRYLPAEVVALIGWLMICALVAMVWFAMKLYCHSPLSPLSPWI